VDQVCGIIVADSISGPALTMAERGQTCGTEQDLSLIVSG